MDTHEILELVMIALTEYNGACRLIMSDPNDLDGTAPTSSFLITVNRERS